jgi:tetratricopeptide (TPR) repeat protein
MADRTFRRGGVLMNDWQDAEQHVEKAHEAYEAGRWDEAESELRRALALNPTHPEWLFNLGLTLSAAGRVADAAEAFQNSFEAGEDPHAAIMTGVSQMRAGQIDGSIEWFEKAARLDPSSSESFVHRIEAYRQLGEHEQAELMFYMAQQVDASSPDAFVALADSLLDRRQHERAVWCLREAAKANPEFPGVQGRLADAYAATGRNERARQLYLRELRRDPGDVETLLNLGTLLVVMNRLVEAGEKFRRVLEIQPDHAEAHFELADLAQRQGLAAEAIAQFDVVLRLDPDFPGARRRMARLLQQRAKTEDRAAADALLRREVANFRTRPSGFEADELSELGELLLDAGMTGDGVRILRELVSRRPEEAAARHLLSVALLRSGEREAGMEEARTVLRLESRFVPAMHNLAMACMQDKQWRRARYWLRQARRIDTDDPSIRRLSLLLKMHAIAEVAVWATGLFVRRRPR